MLVTIYIVQKHQVHVDSTTLSPAEAVLATLPAVLISTNDAAIYEVLDTATGEETVFLDRDFLRRLQMEAELGAEILDIGGLAPIEVLVGEERKNNYETYTGTMGSRTSATFR